MEEHSQTDELIDLGSVLVETKGVSNQEIQDEGTTGANQKFPLMGTLTAD